MNDPSIPAPLPKHVGIILDGNRRWAKQNGVPAVEGHRRGAEVFREVSLQLFDSGIDYISAYIFSAENWSRTEEEVSYLMKLVIKAVSNYLEQFKKAGIRIRILGSRHKLSDDVLAAIRTAEEETKNNEKGTLALCFNYGGQEEIVAATQAVVRRGVPAEAVTKEVFEAELYGGKEVPPIDLLIRTSGEERISGFMLYRVAYAEFVFIDTLWPDIAITDMKQALEEYAGRQRRHGV